MKESSCRRTEQNKVMSVQSKFDTRRGTPLTWYKVCCIKKVISSGNSIQLGGIPMPEQATIRRAQTKQRQGKAPSTQAGEFVKEEIDHIREGKHGARSTKQAIAIGLSKARRAGIDLKPPPKGKTSQSTRQKAERDYRKGHGDSTPKPSTRRSAATLTALKREGRQAASKTALSKQAKTADRMRAGRRTAGSRTRSRQSR